MMPEDVPPEWMWEHQDALDEWFDEVKARRDSNSGPAGSEPDIKNEDPRLLALKSR